MMTAIRQALVYGALTGFLLAIVVGVGAAAAAPVLRRVPRAERLACCTAAGVGILVLTPTWYAYSDRRIAPLAIGFGVVALIGLISWSWLIWSERRDEAAAPAPEVRGIGAVVAAALAALLQYRRVFTSGFLPSTPTAFTNFNNDLGIYVLQADNVRAIGYGELGRSGDLAIGAWTKGDHTGSSALSALLSSISRLPSWQMAIPVIAVCTAASILMLVRLAGLVGAKRRLVMWAAALWAVCAPFPSSIQTNYFLGQMVSRTLLVALVLAVTTCALGNHERRVRVTLLVLVAVLVAAGLVAYPAGHLAALLVAGGLAVAVCALSPRLNSWRARILEMLRIGAAAAIGAVSTYPRRQVIIDSVELYSKDNVSGFRNETLDIRVLLGVPGDGRALSPWAIAFVTVILTSTLAGGWVLFRKRDLRTLGLASSMVLLPAVLYVAVCARGSTSSYQTWKTLGSVQLFAIVGVAVLSATAWQTAMDSPAVRRECLEDVSRSIRRWGIVIPAAALLGWVVGGAQDQWKSVTASKAIFGTRHIRPEVAGLGGSALVRAQPDLRIQLSPFFETMVAAVAANLYDVHWASDTYLGGPSPSGTCVLTTTEAASTIQGSGPAIPVGKDLVLVPVPFCAPAP